MRVKLDWLNELVDLTGLSVKEIVDRVSLYSIEVETVEKIVDATNIVIGHVLTKTPHPDSDHLNVLTVDVGKEVLQIVCGAPNVDVDQYVIVALVGACLPGGFEIKDSKIRGVESHGMCCSLQELGIENKYIPEEYAKGIYYFKDGAKVGEDARVALGVGDEVLTLGITPNRGDLLSMIGVAIEFAASFNRKLKPLAYEYMRSATEDKNLSVKLESDKCLTYYAQIIRDVEIKESPLWLKSRLISFGVRAINNVVDITNYILALFGQPLHSFDLDVLGNNIVVRNAKENETIVTLDEVERKLLPTDLVITDGTKPVALAGVMGGINSGVSDKTKNVLIEAAVFDPLTIRRTAARLFLHSESSARYERGVDVNRTKEALEYTNYLFATLCNGKVDKTYVHEGLESIPDKEIDLTLDDVNGLLGTDLKQKDVEDILSSLGFVVQSNAKGMVVSVPNRRPDISIRQDLVEEIGRLHGYEKLQPTIPTDDLVGGLYTSQRNEDKLRTILTNMGLFDVVTYSLVKEEQNNEFTINHIEDGKNINLLMPLTEDRAVLRKSLVPSIIDITSYNHTRKNKNYSVFEIGKVYAQVNEEYIEEYRLAGSMSGTFSSTLHAQKCENVDFFLAKGIIDEALSKFNINLKYVALDKECKELHPTRSASLYNGEELIGFLGQVHPRYAKEHDIDSQTILFELKIDSILNNELKAVQFKQINKLPSVERDIALVCKKNVTASSLVESIKKSDKELLSDVSIFDVYTGEKVGEDEKSIALKLTFTSDTPLTDEVINDKIKKILKDLQYRCGATLREI